MPWVSSASTGVPRETALDNLREDGWVLMHNSFTLESGAVDPKKYLLFYNKYSGILRMWYWHDGTNASTQLKYSIQFLENTSLLNFNGEFQSPMDERQPQYSEYISGNTSIASGQGLSQNTWYLFDFEIGYDENVNNISKEKSDMILGTRGMDISNEKFRALNLVK